jgi:AraC-like DNA-binding protein
MSLKLKKGYKYFFQTTVFGDIHRRRMQLAKELLREGMMNVTEVAYHIGYNNLSSFFPCVQERIRVNPAAFDHV